MFQLCPSSLLSVNSYTANLSKRAHIQQITSLTCKAWPLHLRRLKISCGLQYDGMDLPVYEAVM